MKINFIELEHWVLDFWKKEDIFNKLVKQNEGNTPWSFIDGPIMRFKTGTIGAGKGFLAYFTK